MTMEDYMQDLMRAQKASQVRIVLDASFSSLPGEDPLVGSSSHSSSADSENTPIRRSSQSSLQLLHPTAFDDSCGSLLGNNCSDGGRLLLGGFRDRHRRIKETMSPMKIYKWSPATNGNCNGTPLSSSSSSSSTLRSRSRNGTMLTTRTRRRDNQRSRLIRLASDSNIIDGPPELTDFV